MAASSAAAPCKAREKGPCVLTDTTMAASVGLTKGMVLVTVAACAFAPPGPRREKSEVASALNLIPILSGRVVMPSGAATNTLLSMEMDGATSLPCSRRFRR